MEIDQIEQSTTLSGKIKQFIEIIKAQSQANERFAYLKDVPIIFITSGSTQVPLEKNTIRSIENGPRESRGTALGEQFLKAGFPVVFLHRD
jgi:hypothetical protein